METVYDDEEDDSMLSETTMNITEASQSSTTDKSIIQKDFPKDQNSKTQIAESTGNITLTKRVFAQKMSLEAIRVNAVFEKYFGLQISAASNRYSKKDYQNLWLTKYFTSMKKSFEADGTITQHPFVSKMRWKHEIISHLRRILRLNIMMAVNKKYKANFKASEKQLFALSEIDSLNLEIICSIATFCRFSTDIVMCAHDNCRKVFNHVKAKSLIAYESLALEENNNTCVAEDCIRGSGLNADLFHVFLSGGRYTKNFEDPEGVDVTEKAKVITLCSMHKKFFELMYNVLHMNYNIFRNCDKWVNSSELSSETANTAAAYIPPETQEVITLCSMHKKFFELMYNVLHMNYNIFRNCDKWVNSSEISSETANTAAAYIPPETQENVIAYYAALYQTVFALGKPDQWNTTDFTLF